MKAVLAWSMVGTLMLGGATLAAGLKDEVKVEIGSAGAHADMAPGTYVCAAGHFHVKATVQNLAAEPVGPVKVAGKVFDAEGKVIGTATATTRRPSLNPNDKADVDLEFLTVTGPLIKQVKNQEISVVAVAPKP